MTADKTPAKDTIYLDVDDDITSAIDKVEASTKKVVALVLPKKSAVLQSIVNMRLLARSADEADKKIVLVTNDAKILPLAGAAKIHVAKNLSAKPYIPPSPLATKDSRLAIDDEVEAEDKNATLDYHRSIGGLVVNEEVDEPETIELSDAETTNEKTKAEAKPSKKEAAAAGIGKKLKVPNFDKFRLRLALVIAGLIGLIIFLFLATKVLPKATVTIKTNATPLSASFEMITSDQAKAVDKEKAIIPASLKTSDQTSSQQVATTGQQNNGEKAKGSVSMTAQDCSAPFNTPADVPAGSGLSANGLTYITQAKTSFSITGASGSCVNYNATSATDITAQSGGAKYNVGSGTSFSVSGRADVSATGSASGGTDNIAKIVAQTDIDEAKKKITSQSSDEFSKTFQKQLADQDLYVITPSLKIAEPAVTASPDVGQPASTVSVTIKITHSVVAVKKDELKQLVSDKLNKQIDTSRQQILDDDVLKNLNLTIKSQNSPVNLTLSASVETSATPNIDVESIKRQVGGLEKGAIQKLLSEVPGAKEVDTKMSPFWVSTAPKNPGKVKVILEQVSDKNAN